MPPRDSWGWYGSSIAQTTLIGSDSVDAVSKRQRNFAITTSGVEDPLALRYCIDRIGADNIMWAIDYPYQPTSPAVAFIESAPMSDTHREKIAYKNAERIFRISARA